MPIDLDLEPGRLWLHLCLLLGLRLTRWLRQRLGFTADARGVLGSVLVTFMIGGDPPNRRSTSGEQFLKTVRPTL
jgi:hypothetical protein